jgi:TadE-like protein
VIVLPCVLLAFWLVLQFAIVLHAKHLAQAAAQDAAAAGAVGGDAAGTASALMDAAGGWVSDVDIAPMRTAREVRVRVTADVLRVFPLGSYSVEASGAAPIEEFIPQPARP